MRSLGVAVVVVLTVLQAATLTFGETTAAPTSTPTPELTPEPPIGTTTQTTTAETTTETIFYTMASSCMTGMCAGSPSCSYSRDFGLDQYGCPNCGCSDPICGFAVVCGPDEDCLPSEGAYFGYDCFSKYVGETTAEPTSAPTPEMTTESPIGTITETATTETTTTETIIYTTDSGCRTGMCAGSPTCVYSRDFGLDERGCPYCVCSDPICGFVVVCGPDEDCLPSEGAPYGYACFSKYGNPLGPTVTTTPTPTPTTPPIQCTAGICPQGCWYNFVSRPCPTCYCGDPCQYVTCDTDEECVPKVDCSYSDDACYSCVSIYATTQGPTGTTQGPTGTTQGPTGTTQGPMGTTTQIICDSPFCPHGCDWTYDFGPCPTCDCRHPCQYVTCDTDEECVPRDCTTYLQEWCYSCVSIYETPTQAIIYTPATPVCMTGMCAGSTSCTYNSDYGLDERGCPRCSCSDPICGVDVICGPDEDCLPSDASPYGYACFSKYETTTSITTPSVSPTANCSTDACIEECRAVYDLQGCITCDCSDACKYVECPDGTGCLVDFSHCKEDWPSCWPELRCVPGLGPTSTPETTEPITTTDVTPTIPCYPPVSCQPSCIHYDADGCFICQCLDPCEELAPCPTGTECRMQYNCDSYPCYECSPATTTTPCPMVTCGRHCYPGTGSDGCQYCTCPTTCEPWVCQEGYHCVVRSDPCPERPCPIYSICAPITTTSSTTPSVTPTVMCPMVTCNRGCRYIIDSQQCPNCDCKQSCETLDCRDGYVCEMQVNPCFVAPCPSFPVCVQMQTTSPCPMYKCRPDCVPDIGADGCPSCACPPSCETVKCSAGYECKLVEVTCIRYPCFPQPQCVLAENPCFGTPNPHRCGRCKTGKYRWTYNSVTDTCERFRYYGCTPSPNTFSSKKACKNRCQAEETTPICLAVVCADDCYTFTKRNQCPKCICPNPCQVIRCRSGYECKLREAECGKDPEPFCAPTSCPQDPCNIRCMYGLKTDENGCQLCECLEEPRP